jgi:putative holliday junction resolvase
MVVGQPHRHNGLESKMSPIIATWVARLQGETGLPVYIVDEALSSVEAEQELRRAGRDTRQDKGEVDERAAQIILEQYWREQGDA